MVRCGTAAARSVQESAVRATPAGHEEPRRPHPGCGKRPCLDPTRGIRVSTRSPARPTETVVECNESVSRPRDVPLRERPRVAPTGADAGDPRQCVRPPTYCSRRSWCRPQRPASRKRVHDHLPHRRRGCDRGSPWVPEDSSAAQVRGADPTAGIHVDGRVGLGMSRDAFVPPSSRREFRSRSSGSHVRFPPEPRR